MIRNRHHLRATFLLLVAGVSGAADGIAAQTTAEVARLATPATVTILTYDSLGDAMSRGSGFVVRDDGVIVTNYHVMDGASSAVVRFKSGETFEKVEALESDADHDIAVIKIPGSGHPSLVPAHESPVVGSRVVVIGAPRGLEFTVSEGIVSAVRMEDGREWIQMSAPISPGSSGGPVLDTEGHVIGITTAYRTDGQALNFAVPIRYATGLVAESGDSRPIAAAFSGTGGAPAESAGGSAGIVFPKPAENAESWWLADTYRASGRLRAGMAGDIEVSMDWIGGFLLAAPDRGLFIRMWEDDSGGHDPPSITFVLNSFATRRGRIRVETPGQHWEGYFTPDGGMALVAEGEEMLDSAVATPVRLDLDARTGLYELEWQSRPAGLMEDGEPVAWSGRAAMAVERDSIWVDLGLENEEGGTSGFFAVGAIKNGMFTLQSPNGDRLVGVVGEGSLVARFYDKRLEGEKLQGWLKGTRQ